MGRPKLLKAEAKGILIGARFSSQEAKTVNAVANRYVHGKSEWIRKKLLEAAENKV